jgi:hypothetical protein
MTKKHMKTTLTYSLIRKLFFAIILLLIFGVKLGMAQTWKWATSSSGSNADYAHASCTDASGNIITAGEFLSNPLQMGTVTLNNSGGYDAYVAKYDPNGTVIWAQKIGGGGNESITGVSTDAAGNVYVVGTFNTQFLSVAPLPTIQNFTTSTYDIFVGCYNSAGVIQWLKGYGGALNESSGGCVYSNSLSCLYIGGNFYSTSFPIGTFTLTNTDATGNKQDMFLARITGTTVTWAKGTGSSNSNEGAQQLAIDSNSDLYYSGFIAPNSLTTTIGTTMVTTYGGYDNIVGKYNAIGTPIWVKNWGSTVNCTCDFGGGISIDAANNIFLGTTTNGSALIAGTFTTPTSGAYDAFVVKTNSVGVFQWVTKIGALGDQYANSVTNDNNGNVFVTGSFSGTNVVVGSATLTNSAPGISTDIFVIKLSATGATQWGLTAAGPNADESGSDITCDGFGNIFVSGNIYTSSVAFGTTTLISTGANDLFLAKIACLTPTITGLSNVCSGSSTTLTAIGASSYTWNTSATGSSVVVTPTANTTYSLMANSGSCTVNSSNYSVTVLPASVNAGPDFSLVCNTMGLMSPTCNPANPIGVLWTPATGLSSATILSPTVTAPSNAISYAITCTLTNGCVATDTVVVSHLTAKPDICIVTCDSLNNNNEIYWDKLAYPLLDSMIIYREVSTNVYKRIGAVPSNSISLFTDTVRSIGPSNGDPKITTYRYKIQMRDVCGVYGPMSLWHNTIYFTRSGSTFFWVNNYLIEGPTNPVNQYSLIVCPNPTVSPIYQLVGTTAGNQNQLNDPNYSTYSLTADWRVVGDLGYVCYAQKTTSQGKSTPVTRSNISNNRAAPDIGVREKIILSGVQVFPNPADKFMTVNFALAIDEAELKLTNILGQIIYTEKTNGSKTIDVSQFPKGVYTLTICLGGSKNAYKVIVN